MKALPLTILCGFLAGALHAAEPSLTPAMQARLDEQKKIVATWAAEPVVVAAVKEQNEKGPIPGLDNKKWSALAPGDPIVVAFEKNPAAEWLAAKLKAGEGFYTEAFLNAAKGEKAAFVEKTTSYTHAGRAKFEAPMKRARAWQGKPELDVSSKAYAVQISAPVLEGGKPIGVLVVGIAIEKLRAE